MILNHNWFQLTPPPADAMSGNYDLKLVALSYIIAVLASYVALDLVGRLRLEKNPKAKLYWLFGGAFAMGAGIWSMHFIGMLAFIMSMPMAYDLFWTGFSLLAAILVSAFALFLLRQENQKLIYLILGGVFIGFGIATMHYMGMEGMIGVNIRYLPGLFFLSIAIAIFAAEAALWLALQSNQGSEKKQFNLKVMSALIMGIAICGMHYTGMAAAIFTPSSNMIMIGENIRPDILAIFIAGITVLVISLALVASSYYKHMVNSVQNEKEFLNAMLDNLEDGIIACDANGKITVLNDVLQKNIGFLQTINNFDDPSTYFDLYPLDSDMVLSKDEFPLKRALKGERIHAMEFVMKFKNGLTRDIVIDGQPIMNSSGNKLGAVVAMHDITEIKKTEKIKNEFVSVVSHELRTPLTSIRGSLGLLLGGTVGEFTSNAGKLLDVANRNCERLLLLINDILDMEKIQAGKMQFNLQVINISELVKESILTNKMYGEKYGVEIELKESVNGVSVYADPDRLMQVLANLISNAAKFSPQGGIVILRVEKIGNKIRTSVTDSGTGIPLEFQSRIFQKFSQADSSDTRGKGGTGLGLSISKAIIEKLDGTLKFVSKPGKGTTFYFELPIYFSEKNLNEVTTEMAYYKNLLVCEDDADQATYLNLLLETAGIHSDIAITVAQAKNLLAKNTYDAIILDLVLPDQDGISFIRELHKSEKTKNLPIIVLSVVKTENQELLNGDALLVIDWLEKPVKSDVLLASIARLKKISDKKLPHILHVEDDIDTQNLVAMLLEKEASITATSNIKEAIQKIGKSDFDLVILDIALPDGNGCDLIPIFAKYKLPIIVYSAYELDEEYAKYVSQALVKSKITNTEFLTTIKDILIGTTEGSKYDK